MTTVIFLTAAVVEFFTLSRWFSCVRLQEDFHFSKLDLSLRLLDSIHLDKGVLIPLVRLFHNKAIGTVFDLFKHFVQFFDISFLIQLLSIVGVFGFLYAVFTLIKTRAKAFAAVAIVCSLLLVVEIVINPVIPSTFKVVVLFGPYIALSLYGIKQFAGKKLGRRNGIILAGLILLSIWWILVFGHDITPYCVLPQ